MSEVQQRMTDNEMKTWQMEHEWCLLLLEGLGLIVWQKIGTFFLWLRPANLKWLPLYGKYQPKRLGFGNLHDSLYVEYCGWEYGLPEKSPPIDKRKQKTGKEMFRTNKRLTGICLKFVRIRIC